MTQALVGDHAASMVRVWSYLGDFALWPRRPLWKRQSPGPAVSWSGQGTNQRGASSWFGAPRKHHAGAFRG
eukprot:8925408-Alexandrium_andersonii.AAC.1